MFYKVDIFFIDLDCGVYEMLCLIVVWYFFEIEECLVVCLLVYVLWYGEQIVFGCGLLDVDELVFWEKSLDGWVLYWIEVGQLDVECIIWCLCCCECFSLFVYGNLWVWQIKVLDSVCSLKNINVVVVFQEFLESLFCDLLCLINWIVMISEGILFVIDENGQYELQLEWLQGEC